MLDTLPVPLSIVLPGTKVVIVGLHGKRGHQKRLTGLGIRVGQDVQVLRSGYGRGPILVAAGETRLALGHGMARNILVAYKES
jgi:ferrous iron transport protein A